MSAPSQLRLVSTYTAVHGAAEFLTALTLFSMLPAWGEGWLLAAYSAVAFGGPIAVAALTAGRLSGWREGWVGLAGTGLLAVGMLLCQVGWACAVVLGAGSAALHIAAGTATLKAPARGNAVGVFESSGAVGLALGSVVGASVGPALAETAWIGVGAAAIALGGLAVAAWGSDLRVVGLGAVVATGGPSRPIVSGRTPRPGAWTPPSGGLLAVAALVALSVISVLRAVAGVAAPQPWKQGVALVLAASVCVAAGRALGGVIADRFGLAMPAIVGFVGAAAGLALWPDAAWAGLAGSFFLALPMAPVIVGLVAVTGRPSLAFGLAQVCQVPSALVGGLVLGPWAVLVVLLLCAAGIVWLAPLYGRRPAPAAG